MAVRKKGQGVMIDGVQEIASSGDVFADLGYNNPEEALTKARLSYYVATVITAMALTQKQAAVLLGVDQPKVSKLFRGQVREFSTERLLRFIAALGAEVEVVIRPPPKLKRRRGLRIPLFRKRSKVRKSRVA